MANLASIAMLAEVDGALVIDKPAGQAAHDVERAVKTHFNLVKIAHGATLDVSASGVFVLLLGEGTRLADSLLSADNFYTGRIRLGRETDTGDAYGRVVSEKDASAVTRDAVEAAMQEFRGDIYQTPPAFSAVRIGGSADWSVVATGKDGAERFVHVYRFTLKDYAPPFVSFELLAGKGVSVRSLALDLGRALGCGASLEELRREKTGKFALSQAMAFMDLIKLDAVDFKAKVIPVVEVLRRP